MYKRVALAVIVFWSSLASAADWQVIADTKLGQLKLDRASVGTEGKITTAVLVYEFKDLQKLSTPPFAVFNKRQDDVLVDCANLSLGILNSRFFEGDKPVSSFSLKTADVKYKPSAAGTMVETVVITVCAVPRKPVGE
jgi:hypothetical protein